MKKIVFSFLITIALTNICLATRTEKEEFIFTNSVTLNGPVLGPAIETIRTDIINETNRAYRIETNLQNQIKIETNRSIIADINLQEQINIETNRAYSIETNLQYQIRIETNRAYSIETNLQYQIRIETNRAYNAETNLQNNLNIVSNSLHLVDTNLQTQIITETNRAYSSETNEAFIRSSADIDLQNQIAGGTNSVYSNLYTMILIETNRAYNAETNIQNNLNIASNALHITDTNLQAQITSETNRAYTSETNLQHKIENWSQYHAMNNLNMYGFSITNMGPNNDGNFMTENSYPTTNTFTLPAGTSNTIGLTYTFIKLGTGAMKITATNGIIIDATNLICNATNETWASVQLLLVKTNKWVIKSMNGTFFTK